MNRPGIDINLAARRDRRDFMESQFHDKGLEAARLDAVTAEDAARVRRQAKGTAARFSDIEVACNLSHRKAWQAVVDSGAEAGVVLEDDAVLGPGFVDLIAWDSYASRSPSLVRLETFLRPVRLGSRAIRPAPGFSARTMVSSEAGSAAYMISAAAAKFALADPRCGGLLVDAYLFGTRGPFLHGRRVLYVSPAPCIQAYKLLDLKEHSISMSDLQQDRQVRYVAAGPFRARRSDRWRRRLTIARWLLEDPGLLLRRARVVPYSGSVR